MIPVRLAPNVEKLLKARIDTLEAIFGHGPAHDAATDEALSEKARAAVRERLGQIPVVEEGDGVFAVVNLGAWYSNLGAQEASRTLRHSIDVRRR